MGPAGRITAPCRSVAMSLAPWLKYFAILFLLLPAARDFLLTFAFDPILGVIKALDRLTSIEVSPVLNYLKATGRRVGLLINFGCSGKLEWQRFVR
jgi:hypothetical protein